MNQDIEEIKNLSLFQSNVWNEEIILHFSIPRLQELLNELLEFEGIATNLSSVEWEEIPSESTLDKLMRALREGEDEEALDAACGCIRNTVARACLKTELLWNGFALRSLGK